MNLNETYLAAASGLELPVISNAKGVVGWRSPSNIALIKYWGKRDEQIPQNPSLSFTLGESVTETTVQYVWKAGGDPELEFLFDGKTNLPFEQRVRQYLLSISRYMPFLRHLRLSVGSHNSFPHSSGIASSASAMSALALCLVDIENELFHSLADPEAFFRKAAFLARLGSGSATRSVYGGFVCWGNNKVLGDATDEAGIAWPVGKGNRFSGLKDAILITSMGRKKVSSSAGHGMMNDHPWAEARYRQANVNFEALADAINHEDEEKFIRIIENEALSLHALMLSSDPGYRLMNMNTWEIVDRVRDFREKRGIFITFTLDAGPNVHVIYNRQNNNEVQAFIREELLNYCERNYWIDDRIGPGPEKLK
jgi:diphosphomevalonate decarboxylase